MKTMGHSWHANYPYFCLPEAYIKSSGDVLLSRPMAVLAYLHRANSTGTLFGRANSAFLYVPTRP